METIDSKLELDYFVVFMMSMDRWTRISPDVEIKYNGRTVYTEVKEHDHDYHLEFQN